MNSERSFIRSLWRTVWDLFKSSLEIILHRNSAQRNKEFFETRVKAAFMVKIFKWYKRMSQMVFMLQFFEAAKSIPLIVFYAYWIISPGSMISKTCILTIVQICLFYLLLYYLGFTKGIRNTAWKVSKHGPQKTSYLSTFHEVEICYFADSLQTTLPVKLVKYFLNTHFFQK